MTEREYKLKVIDVAEKIAKALAKGRDVEVRRSANGVSVAEVKKEVIVK